MAARDDLKAELAEFDGKAVSLLSEITARHKGDKNFLNNIVVFCNDKTVVIADGATWIVKAHLDAGGALTSAQTNALVAAAPQIHSWAAQLHICQILGRLSLTKAHATRLAPWVAPLLEHKRPFLRAWSLDALCALARVEPALQKQAKAALNAASKDDAASVRARARNIKLA